MKGKRFKLLIVLAVLMSTTTVYAYKKDLLKINDGSKKVFDITYNNVRQINNTSNTNNENIKNTDTDINLNTELEKPGDYTEFLVDITNNSNKDAKIDSIIKEGLTERQKKYLDYTIKYLNDEEIKVGDIFNAGETKTAKVKVEYLKNINSEDLPTSDEDIKYSFNIIMVEK